MRKLLPFLFCWVLFSSCDLLNSSKKQEAAKIDQRQQEQRVREENRKAEERKWIDENKETARKTAINFINKEGYSIQSMTLINSSASNASINENGSLAISVRGISQAYFSYYVTTNNTNQDGRLIYIDVRVKYDKPNWIVDSFRPYVN